MSALNDQLGPIRMSKEMKRAITKAIRKTKGQSAADYTRVALQEKLDRAAAWEAIREYP